MPESVQIVAGEQLKALWGHTIMVNEQHLRIGPEGHLIVDQCIAQRLLKQSGWARCDVDEPKADAAPQPEDEAPSPTYRRGKGRKGKK